MKKKILIVFGTRPEAIKMAPLVEIFKKNDERFETIVCVTGQHRKMLDQVLDFFCIKADFDLNIMQQGQDLYDVTSRILIRLRDVLNQTTPDMVMVHGDTTSSTAAAIAAFYKRIPVAHIEAGLRTYNPYSPWPEEMNRQLTSRISSLHFAPTISSKKNLLNEGIKESQIIVTGNTVIDTLFKVVEKISSDSQLKAALDTKLQSNGYDMNRLNKKRRLVLITGHRRENFGKGFREICKSIQTMARKYPLVDFVYPMHLNPNVRQAIQDVFGERNNSKNTFFIEPQEYLTFIHLINHAHVILTDSGGIQEEAPSLGKPVLVMRDTTERPEALESGGVLLVGANFDRITCELSKLLDNDEAYAKMSKSNNPYGDGKASEKILHALNDYFIQTEIAECSP